MLSAFAVEDWQEVFLKLVSQVFLKLLSQVFHKLLSGVFLFFKLVSQVFSKLVNQVFVKQAGPLLKWTLFSGPERVRLGKAELLWISLIQ